MSCSVRYFIPTKKKDASKCEEQQLKGTFPIACAWVRKEGGAWQVRRARLAKEALSPLQAFA